MNAIQEYAKHKTEVGYAVAWKNLIGQRYNGGGGGYGRVVSVTFGAEVYHQYSDGATNYHQTPDALKFAFAEVIKAQFPALLDLAMAALEAKRLELAKLAADEHTRLLTEAGIAA